MSERVSLAARIRLKRGTTTGTRWRRGCLRAVNAEPPLEAAAVEEDNHLRARHDPERDTIDEGGPAAALHVHPQEAVDGAAGAAEDEEEEEVRGDVGGEGVADAAEVVEPSVVLSAAGAGG